MEDRTPLLLFFPTITPYPFPLCFTTCLHPPPCPAYLQPIINTPYISFSLLNSLPSFILCSLPPSLPPSLVCIPLIFILSTTLVYSDPFVIHFMGESHSEVDPSVLELENMEINNRILIILLSHINIHIFATISYKIVKLMSSVDFSLLWIKADWNLH